MDAAFRNGPLATLSLSSHKSIGAAVSLALAHVSLRLASVGPASSEGQDSAGFRVLGGSRARALGCTYAMSVRGVWWVFCRAADGVGAAQDAPVKKCRIKRIFFG